MILAKQLFVGLMNYNMFFSSRSRVFSLGVLIFALCAGTIPLPSYAAFDWNKLLYAVPIFGSAKLAYDAPGFALSFLKGGTQFTISTILKIVFAATEWLTTQLVTLVGPLISAHGFISNPAVTAGWTFIQGLANIGFIIGLLFIALATVLRFQTYSIQRILPRLIIVALLLNFSLVLTGVLIDMAQLGTAVIARAMGHLNAVQFIGRDLLIASDSLQFAVIFLADELVKTPELAGWESVVRNLLMLIVSVVFLSGLVMLVIGLVIRYVMLVLLLIVSPVAFLFWIFPNTTPMAEKWWKEFLRYVFYAPIALFILLLATRFTTHLLGQPINGLSDAFLRIVVVTVMFYMAAIVGKNLGGSVGVAALGFATGTGKRLGRMGLAAGTYLPRKAGQAGLATGRAAGRLAANQVGDVTSRVKKDFLAGARGGKYGEVGKFLAGKQRDEKGKLRPGQESYGLGVGKWVSGTLGLGDPKQQAAANEINKVGILGTKTITTTAPGPAGTTITETRVVLDVPAGMDKYITPAAMRQPHIAKAWDKADKGNVVKIMQFIDNSQVAQGIASDEDYLRTLEEAPQRDALFTALKDNININDQEKSRISNTLHQMFAKIDQ